jgi:hypothetical protein
MVTPMRGRCLLVVALALGATWSLAVVRAGGASAAKGYAKHGVSFRYPSRWSLITPGKLTAQQGSKLWTEWLGPSASGTDLVMLTAYHTVVAITAGNAALYADQVRKTIAQVAKQAGGRILSGPTRASMGGLPGYGFRINAKAPQGNGVESRLVLVWKGRTEFFLNCQHQVGGSRRAEIERGCTAIVRSFRAR